jgi:O-antigen/teichoic acid export membrane protein
MLKNKFFNILINQLNFLFSYLILLYLATNITIENFGILTYIKNIILVSMGFIAFGLDRSSLHLFKDNPISMFPYGNSIKLFLFIVVAGIIYISYLLSYIPITETLLILMISILFISIFDVKYLFDITKTIQYDIVFSYLRIVPLILFLGSHFFFNIKLSIQSYFIYFFIGLFTYLLVQYFYFNISPKFKWNKNEISRIAKYSKFVWIGAIFSNLNNYIDSFMIMNYLGSNMTGIYNFAYTFYVGLLLATSLLVRFFISNTINVKITLKSVHKYSIKMFFISLFIFIGAYNIYPLFINIFFIKYINSIEVFNILGVSFIFVSIASVYGNLLISKGKSNKLAIAMGVTVFVNILLNYIFIPTHSMERYFLVLSF